MDKDYCISVGYSLCNIVDGYHDKKSKRYVITIKVIDSNVKEDIGKSFIQSIFYPNNSPFTDISDKHVQRIGIINDSLKLNIKTYSDLSKLVGKVFVGFITRKYNRGMWYNNLTFRGFYPEDRWEFLKEKVK